MLLRYSGDMRTWNRIIDDAFYRRCLLVIFGALVAYGLLFWIPVLITLAKTGSIFWYPKPQGILL